MRYFEVSGWDCEGSFRVEVEIDARLEGSSIDEAIRAELDESAVINDVTEVL